MVQAKGNAGHPVESRPELGVLVGGGHTRIAVVSSAPADGGQVEFVEIRSDGSEAAHRLKPSEDHDRGWQLMLPRELRAGTRYGFRVSGRSDQPGVTFDRKNLLADPYARAFTPDPLDPRRPRSVIARPDDERRAARPEVRPMSETVIYETHVRSLTKRHPDVPAGLRGTYAGLAHESVLDHLTKLGVTTVELMPIQQHVPEAMLIGKGLSNLWGYSTLGFFAPDFRFSASGSLGNQVSEFCFMVDELHRHGLEVILDVVYNHTAEGGRDQPALCWRGLGDDLYYLRKPGSADYDDVTSCGNTLDFGKEWVRRFVLDSLRYWFEEMRVDGFRFDLGAAMVRRGGQIDEANGFLSEIQAAIPQAKLIIEPWDGRANLVGRFGQPWVQWNDKFRDSARRFWLTDAAPGEIRERLAGSRDILAPKQEQPGFVNYVASHDGRTGYDAVAYADKHNEANQEQPPGGPDEVAVNHGVEGPTDDPAVLRRRRDDVTALLALMLMADGVPMLLGGDELLRTQRGNSNAYCQDNEISWYDWTTPVGDVKALVRQLIKFRLRHPGLVRAWNQDDKVWAQPTRGSGAFLGVVDACSHAEATWVAVMINSGPRDIVAAPPVPSTVSWTRQWCTKEVALDPSVELIVPARSVVGAYGSSRS